MWSNLCSFIRIDTIHSTGCSMRFRSLFFMMHDIPVSNAVWGIFLGVFLVFWVSFWCFKNIWQDLVESWSTTGPYLLLELLYIRKWMDVIQIILICNFFVYILTEMISYFYRRKSNIHFEWRQVSFKYLQVIKNQLSKFKNYIILWLASLITK